MEIIVFEGTDGSGKQTQSTRLVKFLKESGKKVVLQSFPNYESPSSALVKLYLNGDFGESVNCLNAYQTSTLFAVDRLYTMKKLLPKLSDDTILILDRYVESNMIHQASKIDDEKSRDEFLEWVYDFEFNVLQLPKPTKTIFLDMPLECSLKLKKERNINKSGTEKDIQELDENHLRKAYNSAKYVSKKYNWIEISCAEHGEIKSIEQIGNEILKILNIKKNQNTESHEM